MKLATQAAEDFFMESFAIAKSNCDIITLFFFVIALSLGVQVRNMASTDVQFEDVLGGGATDKRIEVLRAIHREGSISEAARVSGVSYKAAWQAVETLGNLAGRALIEKVVGGAGGGGTRLTPAGIQVLHAAEVLQAARDDALARVRSGLPGSAIALSGVAAVGLRTSMRNQLPCVVTGLGRMQGAMRVRMRLADDQQLAARITRESAQLLGLKAGMQALALFKATAVVVAPTIVARGQVNLLQGRVSRRASAADQVEVSLELAPGLAVVGFAESPDGLGLRRSAMAAVDEAAVVIGLAG
jgi:molybdate transport system regulatory protein